MKRKKRKLFYGLMDKYRGEGVAPECAHFGECGGCMFQDISYENQLLLKKEYVNGLFQDIASVDEVFPSYPFNYRTRMDLVTAFGKKGFRRSGSYRHVVDVESCPLMQTQSNEKFMELRDLLEGVEDYDYLRHSGYLRYIIIREARFTGEVMVNFVTSVPENRLSIKLYDFIESIDSSSMLLSDGLADLSYGPQFQTIKKGFINETFDSIVYKITPNTFFQSNSEVALKMYRRILSETGGNTLDLYCGIGSISLYVASAASNVTGVEVVEESVNAAIENRDINEIENVNFVCADAASYVKENSTSFDTLIIDPPRSGMDPKMIQHIKEMKLDKIIYMSCNPATCRDNLKELEDYRIDSFEAYDMFPQTPHVETLAVLRKK